MSQPWMKLYAADMRGDPAIRSLPVAMVYALIQAWDLALNGPGNVAELRSNDGRSMRERELRDLANVRGAETRKMFERWSKLGLCVLVDEGDDVLCTFPNLARRQGIDATAAERKRRQRERQSHGDVTAMSREMSRQKSRPLSRDVTGENQNQNKEKKTSPSPPLPRRAPDVVWDAVVAAVGYSPETKSERGKFNRAVKDLKDAGATPDEIARRARAMKQAWPQIRLTPTTLSGNWSAFGPQNGQRRMSQADADAFAIAHGFLPDADPTPTPASAEHEESPI